ncbi:MAG: hypothetical protein WCN98_15600 [Verrucomicrobiaceae bacterium]
MNRSVRHGTYFHRRLSTLRHVPRRTPPFAELGALIWRLLAHLHSMSFQDILKQWHDQDPDFGKVNNVKPSHEFAFEIPGDLTVGQVAAFTDAEAAQQITGVDDYGQPVVQIPLSLERIRAGGICFGHFVERVQELNPSVTVVRSHDASSPATRLPAFFASTTSGPSTTSRRSFL